MRDKLFGLNKNLVDKLILKVKWSNQKELEELKQQIQTIEEENKKFEEELVSLQDKGKHYDENEEILDLAKNRLKNVIQYLDKQKSFEMFSIRDKHEKYMAELNYRLNDLEKELQQVNHAFQNMTGQLWESKSNGNKESDQLPQAFENFPNSKIKQETLVDKEKNNPNAVNYYSNPALVTNNQKKKNNLALNQIQNKESKVDTDTVSNEATFDRPSNTTHIFQQKQINSSVHTQTNQQSVEFGEKIYNPTSTSMDNNSSNSNNYPTNNFWGLDDNLVQQSNSSINTDDSFFEQDAPPPNHKNENDKQKTEISENTTNQNLSSIDKEKPEHSTSKIVQEVDSLKSQYMLGKATGEDIYSRDGRLLVKKDSEITKEIIELSHREGKLAELIVHMKRFGGEE